MLENDPATLTDVCSECLGRGGARPVGNRRHDAGSVERRRRRPISVLDQISHRGTMTSRQEDETRRFVDVRRGFSNKRDWADEISNRRQNGHVENSDRLVQVVADAVFHLNQSQHTCDQRQSIKARAPVDHLSVLSSYFTAVFLS